MEKRLIFKNRFFYLFKIFILFPLSYICFLFLLFVVSLLHYALHLIQSFSNCGSRRHLCREIVVSGSRKFRVSTYIRLRLLKKCIESSTVFRNVIICTGIVAMSAWKLCCKNGTDHRLPGLPASQRKYQEKILFFYQWHRWFGKMLLIKEMPDKTEKNFKF